MPPKGWKKNAEQNGGHLPHKERELVSIDEILFPRATLQKLAKSIIQDDDAQNNMILAKDSLLALQRSSTVFVSYLLFYAKQIANETGRKTVNAQDMMGALERAEFGGFVPEIKEKLAAFETSSKTKPKVAKKPEETGSRNASNSNAATTEKAEKVITKKPRLHDGIRMGDTITIKESDSEGDDDLEEKEDREEVEVDKAANNKDDLEKDDQDGEEDEGKLENDKEEEEEDDDDDEEQENDDDDDDDEEEDHDDDEEEEEEGEEAEVSVNPIAASSKDEYELEIAGEENMNTVDEDDDIDESDNLGEED